MTLIAALQFLLLVSFSFIPVWAGGQAMKCYDQGHLFRSVICVWVAMLLIISFVLIGMAAVRYNFGFVTILSALHSWIVL